MYEGDDYMRYTCEMNDLIDKRQRRLDPAIRRDQILDHAAKVVAFEGTMAANMARIARECGVSKPLVYSHFPNRIALLKELLAREYRRMHDEQIELARLATSLEDFVRRTTRAYLQYCADRGPFIQRLLNEPALYSADEQIIEREAEVRFLARQVRQHSGTNISEEDLFTITKLGLGISHAAGQQVRKAKSLEELIEVTTMMIVSAVNTSNDLIKQWRRKTKG